MALVVTDDHWRTRKNKKCRLFPACPQQINLPKVGGACIPEGLTGSVPTCSKQSAVPAGPTMLKNLAKNWETFHEHFTFCSVSFQEKAKESLVDKDFQDMKSLLSENRLDL